MFLEIIEDISDEDLGAQVREKTDSLKAILDKENAESNNEEDEEPIKVPKEEEDEKIEVKEDK